MQRQRAFTLLEVCLAVLIGLIIVSAALPSIGGLLQERERRKSFEAFDALVAKAQSESMTTRRTVMMHWEKEGLVLRFSERLTEDEPEEIERLRFVKGEGITVKFPAALVEKPQPIWAFWPSGVCEPAIIEFNGGSHSWRAEYDPLTVRVKSFEAYEET